MMKLPAILVATVSALLAMPAPTQEPTPPIPFEFFKQRRQALMQRLKTGVVVMRGSARSGAGLNGFSQSENFYYLTGIVQQNAALILFPEQGKDMLLVEPYSRFTAQWEGKRIVPSDDHAAKTRFDEIRAVTSLPRILRGLFGADAEVQYSTCWTSGGSTGRQRRGLKRAPSDEVVFMQSLADMFPELKVSKVDSHIKALRGVKLKEEIDCITAATRIACAGIAEAIKSTEPGIYEFQIAAAAR
ncbi:MAG: aminopeptidase P N-terminal domain-containing protein, partial [Planctomycetota bacterium]|nr:aminopeptidase P N-terminal domain-containing protein [Planctomycetota bacterium]